MMQPRYIMTCGLNHSGKTTFGRELYTKLHPSIVLDNDTWRLFAQAQYPDLWHVTSAYRDIHNTEDQNMKQFFLQQMIPYTLKNNVHVIHTACHMHFATRKKMIAYAKTQQAKVCLVYFNIDQKIIFQRAQTASLQKDESLYGKGFMGNLEKMISEFEYPDPSEADLFFEVTQPELFAQYQGELLEKISIF